MSTCKPRCRHGHTSPFAYAFAVVSLKVIGTDSNAPVGTTGLALKQDACEQWQQQQQLRRQASRSERTALPAAQLAAELLCKLLQSCSPDYVTTSCWQPDLRAVARGAAAATAACSATADCCRLQSACTAGEGLPGSTKCKAVSGF